MGKGTFQSPGHPWLNEKPQQSQKTSSLPKATSKTPDGGLQKQDVFDMAADLKNAIRGDRIHRSNQAKKNS